MRVPASSSALVVAVMPPIADQQDQPIPELPALEQHEDREHRHDRHTPQCLKETRQVHEEGRGFQDDEDGFGPHPWRVGLVDLVDDVLHRLLNLLHGAALAGPAKVRDPVVDVQAVPRQLVGELVNWRVRVQPIPPRIESASRTVTRTAGTRPSLAAGGRSPPDSRGM